MGKGENRMQENMEGCKEVAMRSGGKTQTAKKLPFHQGSEEWNHS